MPGRLADDIIRRLDALRDNLSRRGAAAFVSVDPDNQTYLTGFRALLYSRPIVLIVTTSRSTLVVPELEEAHARGAAQVDEILAYGERPDGSPRSPLSLVARALGDLDPGARLAVELDRLPMALGGELRRYGKLIGVDGVLQELRMVKSANEIGAIRAAAELVRIGVAASIEACTPGVTELGVDAAGSSAIQRCAAELNPDSSLELLVMTPSGPSRTLLPHVFSTIRTIEEGDVVIHTRQVSLNGYRAELERTLVVGQPSADQARALATARAAQQAAVSALRPGVPASAVDGAARAVIDDAEYGDYAIHRSGHGIGIGVHELPHFRFDSSVVLAPGMVVTIEPGFYVPGLGGFRHSDTFVVTEEGSEPVTGDAPLRGAGAV